MSVRVLEAIDGRKILDRATEALVFLSWMLPLLQRRSPVAGIRKSHMSYRMFLCSWLLLKTEVLHAHQEGFYPQPSLGNIANRPPGRQHAYSYYKDAAKCAVNK